MPSRETTLARTWTLRPCTLLGRAAIADEPDPILMGADRPRVIEADTGLLDLLAFYTGQPNERYTMSEDAERDAEAILRAHGRLGP